jgi:peroxiredoxin
MQFPVNKTLFLPLLAAFAPFSLSAQAAVPTDAREVNPIEVGATAPDVTLVEADGTETRLHHLVSQQPAVLVFYRGGWCPYCNRHLAALGEIEGKLRELGYRIHAVSLDKPEKVAAATAEADFDYSLYSDAPADAAKAFGLAFRVDAETYEKLLGYGINLEAASGRDHHLLPVPAVFIIDRDAKIRFRYYNPDYKERLSGEALLKAARDSVE